MLVVDITTSECLIPGHVTQGQLQGLHFVPINLVDGVSLPWISRFFKLLLHLYTV